MNITVNFGDTLNIYGFLLFCVIGYLNGYLFRDIGLLKIIAILFIVPISIDLIMNLNNVWQATLPFLICAVIGFLGIENSRYYLGEVFYEFKNLIRKIR